MICRICTNEKGLKTLRNQRVQYLQCPMCNCIFVDPYPTRELNQAFQGQEAVERLEREDRERRGYFRRRLDRLEKRLEKTHREARLLEVGCGSGVLLQEALGRGWRADAIEFSGELAASARRLNPAATVTTGDIQDQEPSGARYDASICLDVLEHVHSPMAMIENCREFLKPGGLMMLQTPNTRSLRSRFQTARWDMLDPTQHLNLFAPDALRVLLTTVGFEILEMTTASGTGLEKGVGGWLARVKESVLGVMYLGSALLVVARRPG
jgi:2-polyprenyl-3-methyl-5-hydroxy-6-metoxy-1,4-benzoquinol methylase